MKRKKVLGMVLVVAMTVGSLAGCGGSPNEGQESSKQENSKEENSQQESPEQESSQQESSQPADDAEDETGGENSFSSLLEIDSLDDPYVTVDLYWGMDHYEQAAVERYEAKYGEGTVTVNVVGWNGMVPALQQGIATGDMPSLVFTEGNACFPQYVTDGYFQPITEYVQADMGAAWMDEASMNSFLYCNDYYVFTNASKTKPYLVSFNKTIFEDNGLENPLELQEKGQWTWEKFIECMDLLTVDMDGDGIIDQWGLGPRYKLGNFAYASGIFCVEEVGNGLLKSNWDDPKMLDYYKFVNELQAIQNRSLDADGKVVNNGWMDEAGAMYIEAPVVDQLIKGDDEGNIIGNKEHIDFVCHPTIDGSLPTTPVWDNGYAIPTGAKNPLGGAILGAMILDEINKGYREDLAGYMTEEQIERYYYYMTSIVPQRKNNNVFYGITTDLGESEAKEGENPATIMEKYKDVGAGQVKLYNDRISALMGATE